MSAPQPRPQFVIDMSAWIDRHVGWHALSEIGSLVLGAIVISGTWILLIGMLQNVDALAGFGRGLMIIGFAGPVLMGGVVIHGTASQLRKARRARQAAAQVDTELDRLTRGATGGVAELSPEELATKLTDAKASPASKEHFVTLIQSRKQRILIDDESFKKEVSVLLVEYLQPLPRNAKRVVNRFRVNLLIADSRKLLASPAKVTRGHIGKWLVLSERWPQLASALSAAPERIENLEKAAAKPAPEAAAIPVAANTPTASTTRRLRTTTPKDPFMEVLKPIAPFYVGDEDLRRFLGTKPMLNDVLKLLVHYGTP